MAKTEYKAILVWCPECERFYADCIQKIADDCITECPMCHTMMKVDF